MSGRRDFLKGLAGGVVAGFPTIVPSSALGRDGYVAPSDKIVLGAIGVGRQGSGDMRGFLTNRTSAWPRSATSTRPPANASPPPSISATATPPARQYNDYRELLARSDIDCVLIATGERWHPLIACAAARAGKHMYCEKPLALSVAACQGGARSGQRKQRRVPVRHAAAVQLLLPPCRGTGAQRQNRRAEDHHGRLGARSERHALRRRPRSRLRASTTTCGWARPPGRRTRICGSPSRRGCSSATTDWAAWTAPGAFTTSTSPSGWPTPITPGPVEVEGTATFYTDIRDVPHEYTVEHKYANGVRLIHMDMVTARKRAPEFNALPSTGATVIYRDRGLDLRQPRRHRDQSRVAGRRRRSGPTRSR